MDTIPGGVVTCKVWRSWEEGETVKRSLNSPS